MDCSSCGTENRTTAKFCAGCGAGLSRACTGCAAELTPTAKFCDQCGTPVDDATAATGPGEATRKTITVMFADLVGSTAFGEKVDAETARSEMGDYQHLAQAVIERHGGTVAKFIGDGVMAVFGIPDIAEDDAERAVRAGVDLQTAFAPFAERIAATYHAEVGLRVGINTGEIVVAEDDDDMFGDALNTAARIEGECTPGRVLVGEQTWRLTRSNITYEVLGEVSVKGKGEAIATFQVVEATDATADDEAGTPFVGRDAEIATLTGAIDMAISERSPVLVTVVGSPGVGKTRLAAETRAIAAPHAESFDLRVDRAGTVSFGPIGDLLRQVVDLGSEADPEAVITTIEDWIGDDGDPAILAPLLATFVGAAPARSTEESFWGSRRLVEILAARRPTVIVVDDIQWAQPLFLDLLEHLVEWVDGPAALICLARPEIREIRPSMAEVGRRVSEVVSLEGLGAEATEALATGLLGAALPQELVDRLPTSTDGNPLFVRELVRMLVDDGVVHESDGRWELAIDPDAVEVPPTIQSLLASRVERMPADERHIVELAAVVGSEFARGAVAALLPLADRAGLDSILERLRRKEIIDPTGAYWGDEPILRFHHVLIRDASYRRMLKQRRATLHQQVAEWTANAAERFGGEHEITIGFHYEQAHEFRTQLGAVDAEAEELGIRAAHLFRTAAERALAQDDLDAAGSLAERALTRLPEDAPERADLLVIACESFFSSGNVRSGDPHLEELRERATDHPRLTAWTDAFAGQRTWLTEPDRLSAVEPALDEAAGLLDALNDQAGVAKARLVRALVLARLGRVGDCETELDAALTAARAADDRRRITAVLGAAPLAALWGPSPVARAGGRCLDIIRLLRITSASPMVEATSIRCQAVLEAMRGRFDQARELIARARATVEELGLRHGILETDMFAGVIELFADDPAAAEPYLRRAYAGLGNLGIGADAGQAAALLSRALVLQGRLDEAGPLAVESQELAGQNLQTAIASRAAGAEIAAEKGQLEEAIRLAEAAVEIAAGTDLTVDHARAAATLALVHDRAGNAAAANEALTQSARLFEAKGAQQAAAITRVEAAPATTDASVSDNVAGHATRLGNRLIWSGDSSFIEINEPDVCYEDHRQGAQSTLVGTDQMQAAFITAMEGLPEFDHRVRTVATRGEDIVLVETSLEAIDGSGVVSWFQVNQMTAGARFQHCWSFDTETEARQIFDTLTPSASPEAIRAAWPAVEAAALGRSPSESSRLVNAATRLLDDVCGLVNAGEWESAIAQFTEGYESADHRMAGHPAAGARDRIDAIRSRAEFGTSYSVEPIAIRGEQLALVVWRMEADNGFVNNTLIVTRVNAEGRADYGLFLDEADLPLAQDELNRIYAAGEGVDYAAAIDILTRFRQAHEEADFATLQQLIAADGVFVDNRRIHAEVPLSTIVMAGTEERSRAETHLVVRRYLSINANAMLGEYRLTTNEDGRVIEEEPSYTLVTFANGEMTRMEIFLLEDRSRALARFEELTATPETLAWNTAATLAKGALEAVYLDKDLEAAQAYAADDMVREDRRAVVGSRMDQDDMEANFAEVLSSDVTLDVDLLATVGDHLAVLLVTGTRVGSGFASPYLSLVGAANGKLVLTFAYAEDAQAEAVAEMNRLLAEDHRFNEQPESDNTLSNRAAVAWIGSVQDQIAENYERFLGRFSPNVRFDDLRRLGQEACDFEWIREFFASGQHWATAIDADVVAIRGENLCLAAAHFTKPSEGLESRALAVVEVDDDDLITRLAYLEPDATKDAVDLLHEWWAEGESPERADIIRLLGRTSSNIEHANIDALAEDLAEDFEFIDNRELGLPAIDRSTMRGLTEAWNDGVSREEIFATEFHRLTEIGSVASGRHTTVTPEGFEAASDIVFMTVTSDGKIVRSEWFDGTDVDRAIGRFDELTGYVPEGDVPRNRAHRVAEQYVLCVHEGRFDDLVEVLSPDVKQIDHRPIVGIGRLTREAVIDGLRNAPEFDPSPTAIAVRGDDCAVGRVDFHVDGFVSSVYVAYRVNALHRIEEMHSYGEDQLDEALAKLDELADPTFGLQPIENLANWAGDRWVEIVADGDLERLRDLCAPEIAIHDHRGLGSYDQPTLDDIIASSREWTERDATLSHEVIATRGRYSGIRRATVATPDGFEVKQLVVGTANDAGQFTAMSFYEDSDLTEAEAEVNQRWITSPDAPPLHAIAAVQAWSATRDQDLVAMLQAVTDDYLLVDHHTFGLGILTAEEYWESLSTVGSAGAVSDLAPRILRITRHVVLLQVVTTVRNDHGAVQEKWDRLYLTVVTPEGKLARNEWFDPADEASALERFEYFDAIHNDRHDSTLAQRASAQWFAALEAGDLDQYASSVRHDFVATSFRTLSLSEQTLDRDAHLEIIAAFAGLGFASFETTQEAVRGERLILREDTLATHDGNEITMLMLAEVDHSGCIQRLAAFEPDRLGDALRLLRDWWLEADGAPFRTAIEITDRMGLSILRANGDGFRECITDTFAMSDRRSIGSGDLTVDQYLDSLADIQDTGAWRTMPRRYLRLSDSAVLLELASTVTGGAGFGTEGPRLVLFILRDDLVDRLEWFDVDDTDTALARFDELTSGRDKTEAQPSSGNAATRVAEEFTELFVAQDLDAAFDLFAENCVVRSTNWMLDGELSPAEFRRWLAETLHDMNEGGSATSVDVETVAFRGDRVSVSRNWIRATDRPDWDQVDLYLIEVNEAGQIIQFVTFDSSRLREALDELNAIYIAGEGAAYLEVVDVLRRISHALEATGNADHNQRMQEVFAADLEFADHRSIVGLGTQDRDETLSYAAEGERHQEITPRSYPRIADRAAVVEVSLNAKSEGGFEAEWSHLTVVGVENGQANVIELYDPHDIDTAISRFDELMADAVLPARPFRSNRASVAAAHARATFLAGDLEGTMRSFRDDLVIEDRRPLFDTTYTKAEWRDVVKDLLVNGEVADSGTEVLAIRGEIICLQRTTSDLRVDGFVQERLAVAEVDDDGLSWRYAYFDRDQLADALSLLDQWWNESLDSAAQATLRLAHALAAADAKGDEAALRTLHARDFLGVDHRQVGLGQFDLDGWIGLKRTQEELAQDRTMTSPQVHLITEHGIVMDAEAATDDATWSTVTSQTFEDGLLKTTDIYDLNDVDLALARFNELTAGAPEFGPLVNRAHEAMLAYGRALFDDHDLDAAIALWRPDSFIEDRTLVSGGRRNPAEMRALLADVLAHDMVSHARATVRATRGDRLCLADDVVHFSVEGFIEARLTVVEVDEDGLIARAVVFDPEAVDAAIETLNGWYAESLSPGERDSLDNVLGLLAAELAGDEVAFRTLLAPDLIATDHRAAGWGTIDRDAWIGLQLAFHSLTEGFHNHIAAVHAISDTAILTHFVLGDSSGNEWDFLAGCGTRDGQTVTIDIHALSDFDAAMARFGELMAASTGEWELVSEWGEFVSMEIIHDRSSVRVTSHFGDTPSAEEFPYSDLAEAQRRAAELWYQADGADARQVVDPTLAVFDSVFDQDWDRLRTQLSADFRVNVRKRIVAHEGGTDQFIESLCAWLEAAGTVTGLGRGGIAYSSNVCVFDSEVRGVDSSGLETEWVAIIVIQVEEGLISRWEEFDADDTEGALARFEELTAEGLVAEDQ